MKVVLTDAARADLIAISDYIAADNPARAASFASELLDSCAGLAKLPRSFPLVDRYETLGVRRRIMAATQFLSHPKPDDRGSSYLARRPGLWPDIVSRHLNRSSVLHSSFA